MPPGARESPGFPGRDDLGGPPPAAVLGIFLRSGCHCNPGVRELALGYSAREMAAAFRDKDWLQYEEYLHVIDGKTTGRRGPRSASSPLSPMSTGSGS